RRSDSLRSAPVLSHNHEPAQTELIDQRNQVGDVMGEGERGVRAGMVRISRADPVRSNGPIAGLGERLDEIAIQNSPGWIAREKQNGAAGTVPFVDISHIAAVYPDFVLRKRKQGFEPRGLWPEHEDVISYCIRGGEGRARIV